MRYLGFFKICQLLLAILLTMILKTNGLYNKPAFNRNNSNRLFFEKNYSNNKINKFGVSDNNVKHTKKLKKSKS